MFNNNFGPNLQDRTAEFMKEYIDKGYHVSKFHSIKESKLNDYGKWYDSVIANVISVRMPTSAANIMEYFFVLVNKKKWFQSADSDRYLGNKKWEKEKFATFDAKICYWMRDFKHPLETVLVLSYPEKFYYVTWHTLIQSNRDKTGKIIFCPEACTITLEDKKKELSLIHESLLSSSNPHEILRLVVEEKQTINSYIPIL